MALGFKGLVLFIVVCVPLISFAQTISTQAEQLRSQADDFEEKAAQSIDEDKITQGMDFMSRAIALDPSATRHMNYGSLLFGNGVAVFKDGNLEKGREILKQAEEQLNKAIQAFDPTKDHVYLSQCYFLLGEMRLNAFGDKLKAKEYYKKAADLNDYTGAKEALKRL